MTSYLLKGGIVATYTKDNEARAFKADVLVEKSVITQVGEGLTVPNSAEIIDCTNKWITPGFVDTHRHVWMTVMRASQCDWLLTEYLLKNSWSIQANITAEQVRIGQLAGCLEALHSGVTTILDHFHAANTPEHADASLDATLQSGARVIWSPSRMSPTTQYLPNLAFDTEAETYKWQMEKLREWGKNGGRLSEDGRVTLGLAYDIGDVGDAEAHKTVIDFARSIPVAVITAHVVKGPRILAYHERGLLGPDVVLSHCTELADHPDLDDEMWAAMKETGTAVASTPEDEMGMAHGNPVAFEAVERGVKCGLGADCLSINSGDIFTQMRFALQFHRARQHEHIHKNKLPPPAHNKFNSQDAFRLGTLGGAEALNLSHLIGTVEVGKKADLLIFDALSANLAGALDPFQGVVFHASNADIEIVLVNGEIVKRNGVLTKVPWGPVALNLRKEAEEIRRLWPVEKLEKLWVEYHGLKGGNLDWVE
ncbi:hypothetical protein PHLGIDRAFT_114220 [Phlebiopsis gigantea 11061_1 CR5-6]|uniref:Amidohydrolase-related domain-containing protein n=1 Tax=Phlebiopsis gigantea (strain 11061_1 CR5-6) TaxID=745531 RepID=A0A0C3PVK0_PHLG1|nr:hypothetical protein PHLGIDRAFT_114220 [Phlebiopsis gigantea 11061_1 CR5-6]